jgi:hypothetical protein
MLNAGTQPLQPKAPVGRTSKRGFVAAIVITASIVLTLIVTEVMLRIFHGFLSVEIQQALDVNPRKFGVSHPYIGNLHTPNNVLTSSGRDFRATHRTDGHGFRNAWPWPERAEIVVLGDSVTFALHVEDEQAWPAIIASSLPRNRVINLGLIGAGPQQHLRVYETFGIKLSPKVLLVGLFVRNDFWDENMFDSWLKSGAGGNYMVWRDFGRPKQIGFNPQRPLASLKRALRWKIDVFARQIYLYNLLLLARKSVKERLADEPKILHFMGGGRLELFPVDFIKATEGAYSNRRELELVLRSLERIWSTARANGTHVLVVFQPSKEEVYLPLLGEDIPDPGAPLRQELDEAGIDYLDLTPVFRQKAAASEQLFFEVDGHPNARGQALIAENVISHLKENGSKYRLVVNGHSPNSPRGRS